ncbi:hypothetical protein OPU71_20855 [Niveibacterium sp. 24ML]|uniref:hypothetical protein n=1 Tax=Niveibacterium sp. 24ML TaxID=2985512 RepID=UPI0022720C8B|nr:hypothetical protein [Niveibacterium sp. 24ML]MCX9158570.1 hypothetical protein [Niveibacterium sp. 24ML]
MGLDTVETVLWAEQKFGVGIPDGEAAGILTVGQFASYIHRKLVLKHGLTALSERQVFEITKKYLVSHFEMKPEWITSEAEFIKDLGMG